MSGELLDHEDRYWVSYRLDGHIAALYRLQKGGSGFHRWDGDAWVDNADRYLRVARDAANDEVDVEMARAFIESTRGT